ncbi:ABC-type transport system permease [Zymomonas mobilis subsp. mobilis ZM4 = ATCC 31821]|uniref:Transport system permease protein n=2 Tax=Zymomonas mobilis TaxID=542 RepID=Q5NR01_ZYMMO|nr:iron ABC transporter permease [Zymomonas mobilis]AAV88853.2 transport system permease protein [Zymomonas mobilis subsp. mobilis ZM4 = ATCC 31821]AVZ25236.1 ABC-type transport system permease [Zymomonas mobilis subsp. mobilis]AVZ27127.1 ABC-type transport system permease [Zymomonas mobilis subsp. mobilis]AVZ41573.1 ABC-type transport system permease [Zymomonas mobilis subsp. mobilis ZM4 = ATCC 31821]UBQ08056.1 iron ABC transporter permease [Zymomonas mobilis]
MRFLSGLSSFYKAHRLLINLSICLPPMALLSLSIGSTHIGIMALWQAVAGVGDPTSRLILGLLRLPRLCVGLAVGAILGMAGAVNQGYLRNPLADPSLLGTSNAAALGAVLAFYFGLSARFPICLPLFAFIGALAGLLPLLWFVRRHNDPQSLILGGVAIAAFSGACISLALNLSPNPFAAMEIMTWLMGAITDRSWNHVWLLIAPFFLSLFLFRRTAPALDALILGDDVAASLGFDLARLRWLIMAALAIGVGGAVAVSGAIGFVGLIVPHILRPFTRQLPSELLWPSAIGGALLVTLADILVRLLPTQNELQLGVVTAFIGVPIFFRQAIKGVGAMKSL